MLHMEYFDVGDNCLYLRWPSADGLLEKWRCAGQMGMKRMALSLMLVPFLDATLLVSLPVLHHAVAKRQLIP